VMGIVLAQHHLAHADAVTTLDLRPREDG
jgi:hypothetical protein